MTWDGTIDPNAEDHQNNGGGNRTRYCKDGRKVLAPVGYERWDSRKGTKMLTVRCVCLVDKANVGDEGAVVERNFALTRKAVVFFGRFANAIGHQDPGSVFDDEYVERVLNSGYFEGTVQVESYDKQDGSTGERSEIKFFDPFNGSPGAQWDTVIEAAVANYEGYLDWRAENPRGSRSSSSGGGQSGGGGNERPNYSSDDIPFMWIGAMLLPALAALGAGVPLPI